MSDKLKHVLNKRSFWGGKSENCLNRYVNLYCAYYTDLHYSAGNMKQLVN